MSGGFRESRECSEKRGVRVVEFFAQLGVDSSYEHRAYPRVELHIDDAERLAALLGKEVRDA